MGSTDLSEEWRDSDRSRRRKTDGQENKFYTFLNRSASSITRSASRSRRVKDKDNYKESNGPDYTNGGPQNAHATSSRLPAVVTFTGTNDAKVQPNSNYGSSRSAKTHRTVTSLDTSRAEPRQSLSPPVSPHTQRMHQKAYGYSTPPQTPSSSRGPSTSFPSSPTGTRGSSGAELLLKRTISRPNTPSGSSTGLKVFGLLLPSPKFKRVAIEPDIETVTEKRSGHKPRTDSGSSNEPLLHNTSPPAGKLSNTETSVEQQHVKGNRLATSSTGAGGLPSPNTPARVLHKDPPRSLSPRKNTPTPRAVVTPRPSDIRGKQRTLSPEPEQFPTDGQTALHRPQARAPASFLPSVLPRLQRTPPTPERGLAVSTSPRVDSFMSDSVPVIPSVPQGLLSPSTPSASVGRQHAFAQSPSKSTAAKTPQPEVKEKDSKPSAPGLGIARSRSAPGSTRGRMSPCLRIPSPKFFTRERSKSKERDSEKGADSGTEGGKSEKHGIGLGWGREKTRKVTPDSVGAPILRDAHAHTHVRAPMAVNTARPHGNANGGEPVKAQKSPGLAPPPRSPVAKPSLQYIRRGAHGSFDFERPGSRTSSKSGQSNTDEERDAGRGTRQPLAPSPPGNDGPPSAFDALQARHRDQNQHQLKHKSSSPPPPLPTPRQKQRSPPPVRPRARSPLVGSPTQANSMAAAAAVATADEYDDSALPRLSSGGLTRRGTGGSAEYRAHRAQGSLPTFAFEPVGTGKSSTPARPARDRSGATYVDPHTGLTWAPTPLKESVIAEEGPFVGARRSTSVRRPGAAVPNSFNTKAPSAAAKNRISPRELEAATAVITQFKSVLDDAGFLTLQKYIRRYDAQIMPLDGAAGLLVRVQRLLETSAPRTNERRRRELIDSFVRVVGQTS